MPYVPKQVEFTLAQIGCPEFKYKAMDPESKPFGESARRIERYAETSDSDDPEVFKENLESIHEILSDVMEWNFIEMLKSEGDVLPLPKDDKKSVDKLPIAAINLMVRQLTSGESNPLPNRSARRSRRG